MAYRGEHRKRAVGNGKAERIVVEADEVQRRAASAHYQYGVVRILPLGAGILYAAYRIDYRGRGLVALHRGLEEVHVEDEAVLVLPEVPAEIAVSGGVRRGNDGEPVRERREFLLQVHLPLLRELFYGPAAHQFRLAHRELRLYLADHQRKAVKLAVAHRGTHHYPYPRLKFAAGGLAEIVRQREVLRAPYHGPRLGHHAMVPAL